MSKVDRLTPLQRELLEAFFEREPRFFLTGGAALCGYHLGHRTTHDLDLFTALDQLDEGERALADAARAVGARIEVLQTAPGFRRRLARRGAEAVVVDLVRDESPQIVVDKPRHGRVRVDPPEEIQANKLAALLARAEIRDLVDVRALDLAGVRIEKALDLAVRKDAGLTPAQLGWVLSMIHIGEEADLPGGVSAADLRAFKLELEARLARMAWPDEA